MEEKLKLALEERLHEDGTLWCPRALGLAARLGVEPIEIGRAADELGITMSHCQLGLFGHPADNPKGRIIKPAVDIPEELEELIRASAADGRIGCAEVFGLARKAGVGRLEAAGAVEGLTVKIINCQLGCFPQPKPWQE